MSDAASGKETHAERQSNRRKEWKTDRERGRERIKQRHAGEDGDSFIHSCRRSERAQISQPQRGAPCSSKSCAHADH